MDLVDRLQAAWAECDGDPVAMTNFVISVPEGEFSNPHGPSAAVLHLLQCVIAVCRKPPRSREGAIWTESMVSQRDKKPYVTFRWGDEAGRLTPEGARRHALNVLECAEAAESDAFLFAYFARMGLEEEQAALAMNEFRKFRMAQHGGKT